ncbi:hypothetical protein [Aquitalea magnusonii]|nr:hypothetical protein [Aquitalea magnusonii]
MPATKQRRRSAHLEMVGGKGGRQRLWEAIRKLRTDFNMIDLAAKAGTDIDTAKTYLQALEKAGHIEVVQENHGHTDKRWNLLRDNGLEAPRLTRDGKPVIQGRAREAMWRTMRIVRDFTFHELAALASSTEVTVAPTTAKDYLKHLLNAGYLIVINKGNSKGNGHKASRFRFNPARNTGPRPPMIQRTKAVYDPNLGQVVWQEEPDHDC